MHRTRANHSHDSRLRFVFNDAVLLYDLATTATLQDIAITLDRLSKQRYGTPRAIDVIVPRPPRTTRP